MHERPVIAPGLPILIRPDGLLQIGLSARHSLRLPDTPVARRVLAALSRGEVPADRDGRRVLTRLAPVLRDAESLEERGIGAAEAAAHSLRHPDGAATRLADRRRTRVRIVGDLGVDPRPLLAASGLGTDLGRPAGGAPAGRPVTLVLCHGEPDRGSLDPLLRERQPYLLLRAVEGDVVLGPFVDPGSTACLRCVDAHLAEADPMHPVLVSRAARLPRASESPEPIQTAVATMAIGWAVRDLVRYAEGDPVSTWSATVVLGPDQVELVPRTWSPHPRCGCGWARAGEASGPVWSSRTMGA